MDSPYSARGFAIAGVCIGIGLASVGATSAHGQQQDTLKSVAQKAVLSNPEVLQKWHAYEAAGNEKDAAFGGYLPRVDLTAGVGREHRDDPTMVRDKYTRHSSSLALTQMLYDGFATRNEVKRLDHAQRARFFDFLDTSENTASEATRAYIDVLRYRKLVSLAEDNYVRHRAVFQQIQEKAQAGVSRRVDLEQVSGRLALAEANLLTETSNLHDVSARYQRLVGEVPAGELAAVPPLATGLPDDSTALMQSVISHNPAVRSAIEGVRAADSAVDVRKAAYQPRLDLRLKNDRGRDINGYDGPTDNKTAELVLTWNLFNGLSDMARSRQYADLRNVAKDVRNKTCRDVRQTAAIAYNDTRKLAKQLVYLDQHQLATEKARDAYRKQFDIGQRTLLDLLDTENELFQARRAYINGQSDLAIAQARSQASQGNLLQTLELRHVGDKDDDADWKAEGDAAEFCQAEAPTAFVSDKEALNLRAAEQVRESAGLAAAPVQPEFAPTVATSGKCQFGEALDADTNFGWAQSALTVSAMKRLDELVGEIRRRCGRIDSIQIVGHSDRLGTAQGNQEISEQRAVAIKIYLQLKGFNRVNFETTGVGSTQPLPEVKCSDDLPAEKLKACLAPNRRVTISIRGTDA